MMVEMEKVSDKILTEEFKEFIGWKITGFKNGKYSDIIIIEDENGNKAEIQGTGDYDGNVEIEIEVIK